MRLSILVRLRDGFSNVAAGVVRRLGDIRNAAQEAASTSQLGKNFQEFGGKLSGFGTKTRELAADLMKPFMEVEDAAAKLRTVWVPVTGTVEDAMKGAMASARAWSEVHRNSAAEYLETAYEMAGAGLKSTQAIEGTEAALKLATATFGTGGDAANLLAVLYNNMGDKARDVGLEMKHLGDIVAVTQGVFQIANLDQLKQGLTYAVPAAQQFGLSLQEVMTGVGQLNSAGMQGSMAGTAFANVVGKMETASKKLGFGIERTKSGGLNLIGTLIRMRAQFGETLSPQQSVKFMEAFGEEGARGIALLLPKIDELRSNFKAVGADASGAMDRALGSIEGTMSARLGTLKNKFTNMLVDFGEKLVPAIERVLPKLEAVLKWVQDFVNEHPKLAMFAAGFLVFGGAVSSVVGPVIALTGVLISLIAYMRIAKALAIGNAAAAGAAGAANGAAATGLFARLGALFGKIPALVRGGLALLVRFGAGALSLIGSFASGVVALFTSLPGLVIVALGTLLYVYWDEIKQSLLDAAEWWGEIFTKFGQFMGRIWDAATDSMVENIDGIAKAWTRAIDWLDTLPGRLSAKLTRMGNAITDWVDEKAEAIYQAGTRFWNGFEQACHEMWGRVQTFWQAKVNWLVDISPSGLTNWLSGGESDSDRALARIQLAGARAAADLRAAKAQIQLQMDEPAALPSPGGFRNTTGGGAAPAAASEKPDLSKLFEAGSKGNSGPFIQNATFNISAQENAEGLARTVTQRTREAAGV